tara:strand:+ start:128 stop:751 length:624 start_codon:yes stop_codon:yes gene_type:complete
MTRIPASGAMRWLDIQNSFGGSNPIGINEYYRTGANVPNSDLNSNIPTSGQIEATDFRGADGFSGTTCSITAGTSGGKQPSIGYLAGSYGSNLGTAGTTGSAGNGSFKFNAYQLIGTAIIGVLFNTTTDSPAGPISNTSMINKTMTCTGNPAGAFTVTWANNGTATNVPASASPAFGSTSAGAMEYNIGNTSGGSFASGTTYTFSIN